MISKYLWAILEIGSNMFFQFLSIVILSRILVPYDYGIFGMMAIFISLGNLLTDSGLGGALIQMKNVESKDFSTLFWYNLIVSVLCYIVIILLSPFIADFYGKSELQSCLSVYGLYLIISAIGVVQNAILNKELQFKKLALISTIGSFLGFLSACFLASKGYGYWSLIFQQLVYITVRVFLQLYVNHFIPKFEFSIESFKMQFNFGGYVMLSNILQVISSNISSIIIPKIGSIKQNGYFLQASKIQAIPLSIIGAINDKVLFSLLCKTKNEIVLIKDARHFCKKMLVLASLATFLMFPFVDLIIDLLLGDSWSSVSAYLRILLLSSFFSCHQYFLRNIFKSMGKTKIIFKIDVIKSVISLFFLLLSAFWGISMLLWSIVCVGFISSIIYIFFLNKYTTYKYSIHLYDLRYSIILFLIAFIYTMYSL